MTSDAMTFSAVPSHAPAAARDGHASEGVA